MHSSFVFNLFNSCLCDDSDFDSDFRSGLRKDPLHLADFDDDCCQVQVLCVRHAHVEIFVMASGLANLFMFCGLIIKVHKSCIPSAIGQT
jgi:hypothetical protein